MAGGAIRGITVEIGGDTTKLGKAIGESEKKTRSLQVELRQVEKLLKFDPTNTELLAQKQSVLKDAISETSDKLDTLKEAEKQVIAQFERGEIAENQLRAFQREIIQTEKDLGSMKSELSATETAMKNLANGTDSAEKHTDDYKQAVKDAEDDLSSFNDKASETFDTLKTGATVLAGAVTAVGGYALKLSTDFDKAFNTLVTKTGASTEEMDSLNESMENIYANNFGESIEDVADSMATVKTTTNLTGKELESATQNALLMRDTFGFEVNESIRAVNSLMDQFGISADEAYTLLAQGAQKGLNQNDDLLDTINEYSVQFENAGYSAEDMFNMLANGVETGTWSVDKLGDAVKEFNIRMSDGSAKDAVEALGFSWDTVSEKWSKGGDDAKEVFNMLINEMDGLEDTTEGYNIGVGLLGTMFEDLGFDAVYALSQTEGEISKTSDALNQINETKYDDIGSALQGLGRTLETDVINPLGEELKPVVEDAIEYVQANGPQIKEILSGLVDKVGEFITFIVNNGTTIISVIAGIAGGLLMWNVGSMIATIVSAIGSFFTLVKSGTGVMAAFNTVLNANPIGILITVIGGIIIAIATFIATNDDARAKFLEIWNKIKEVFSTVISAIVNFFTVTVPNAVNSAITFFQGLPGKIQSAISNLVTIVSTVFTNVKNAIMNKAQEIYNNLPTGFQLVFQNVVRIVQNFITIFQNYFNIIKTVVQTAIAVVKAIFSGDFASIPGIVSSALSKIKEYFFNILNSAITIVINAIAFIINYFRGWGTTLMSIFASVKTKISTWWSNLKTTFVTKATEIIQSVIAFFVQLPGRMYNSIVGAIAKVKSWGASLKATAKTAITTLVSNVVTTAKTLPGKIYNAILNTIARVRAWGTSLKTTAKSVITNMITTVVTEAKALPGKFIEIGKNVIEGIKTGISNAIGGLYESIKSGLSGLVNKAKEALGIASPSKVFANVVGSMIPAGIAKGVKDNADVATDAVSAMTDDLADENAILNGATINRKLTTTFKAEDAKVNNNLALLNKLDRIYDRLNRLQVVLDSGTLVGETIDMIDAGLASNQILRARGV